MLGLLDTVAIDTLINKRTISKELAVHRDTDRTFVTTQGSYQAGEYVILDKLFLPEFTKSQHFKGIKAYLFDSPDSAYDLIIGRNILNEGGFVIDCGNQVVTWDQKEVEFKYPSYRRTTNLNTFRSDELFAEVFAET